jgi:hypothetical protein
MLIRVVNASIYPQNSDAPISRRPQRLRLIRPRTPVPRMDKQTPHHLTPNLKNTVWIYISHYNRSITYQPSAQVMSHQNVYDMIGSIDAQTFLGLPPQIQEILIDTATSGSTAAPLVESLSQRIAPKVDLNSLAVPGGPLSLTPSSTGTTPTPLTDLGNLVSLLALQNSPSDVVLLTPKEAQKIALPADLAAIVAKGGQVLEVRKDPRAHLAALEQQVQELEPRTQTFAPVEEIAPTPVSGTSALFDWNLATQEGIVENGDTPSSAGTATVAPTKPPLRPVVQPIQPILTRPIAAQIQQERAITSAPVAFPDAFSERPTTPKESPRKSPTKRTSPNKSVIYTTTGRLHLDGTHVPPSAKMTQDGFVAKVPVHGNLGDDGEGLQVIIEARNMFRCPTCDRTFNRMYNLKSHIKTHLNHRPFACHLCHQSFTRNHDLTRHVRMHSGMRPFECDACGRGFARMDAMKKHTCAATERRTRKKTSPDTPTSPSMKHGSSPMGFSDQ